MNPTPGNTTLLRTGQLVLHLEPDGQIAGLALAGQPALDRIYPTVRGPGWTTIPGHPALEQLTTDHDTFTARIRHEHRDGSVIFIWTLTLTGEQGHITITATGRAETDLTAERLGLCLIHPARHAGRSFTATTGQQTIRSTFTIEISPDRLAHDMTTLALALTDSSTLTLAFHGATFDLEDHRNWSDPGWKTYSPTLDSTHPRRHTAGTELTHRLEIGYECATAKIPAPRRPHSATTPAITFTVGPDGALPELTAPASRTPDITASSNPRPLPRSVWFEWDPANSDALTQAARAAAAQATALDVAVLLPARHRITDLARDLSAHAPTLRHISVFDATTLTTPPRTAQDLRESLRSDLVSS